MKIVSSCHVHVGIAFEDQFALMKIGLYGLQQNPYVELYKYVEQVKL